MHRAFAMIILSGLLPIFTNAQFAISGKITDLQTKEPLAGSHIILDDNYKTAVSSSTGQFNIGNLKPGSYHLRISFVGYETYSSEITITRDTALLILLKQATIMGSEVIVTATRAGENSPTTYSTVSQKELAQVNLGQDMPFLLQATPSVVTTSDAGTGIGYSSLRIRGTDLTRINVTIDGIPLNDSESHGVWWVDLPDFASSAESIQIQRGVGTSTNGAAAFGASINIRSDDPHASAYGEVNASAGSFNTYKMTFKAGTGLINNKWAFDGRFSKINSDGYIDRAFANLYSYDLSGGYFGKNSIVRLTVFSGNEETYQAWDGVPFYLLKSDRTYNGLGAYYDVKGNLEYYKDQTDNYFQTHYHLNWLQNINKNVNLSTAFHYTRGYGYYEEYESGEDFADYGLPPVIFGTDTISSTDLVRRRFLDNHFYGFTFGLNFDNKNRLKATIGGAINYYEGKHYGEIIWSRIAVQFDNNYRWYENTGKKSEANLYAKLNYQAAEKLNLYGDLQFRTIGYTIDGIENDLRDISQQHIYNFFNPKLGAYVEIDEQSQAYLSFAVGHREPDRSALLAKANPTRPFPTAERLYDSEAGYKFHSRIFSVEANVYYMFYIDQLVLTGRINDVGDPVTENVGHSYRAGLELSAGIKLLKNLRWDLNGTLSDNKILNFTEYVDNADDWPNQISNYLGTTDIAFSPSIIAGSILSWEPFKKFEVSLYSKYVGKQYIDNTSSDERKLDPYFVNDLLLRYNLSIKSLKEFGISLKINNLTNAMYESNAWVYRYYSEGTYGVYDGYFPQAGINFLVGLDLKFY
jgi:iron complex outermembrane recepter protein